jgi:DNA-3-methyladenine glycosylase
MEEWKVRRLEGWKKPDFQSSSLPSILVTILPQDFYARPTLTVARELLGQRLVRELDGQRLSGLIVETEAYIGPDDSASHAYRKRNSDRAQVMFGPPGRTYVYFIYGMHFMLNIVTEVEGFPAAVLIRATEPQEGIDLMQTHRFPPPLSASPPSRFLTSSLLHLANGPAKLCQALRIDKKLNNWDLTQGQDLWLEAAPAVPADAITTGPRVGIDYAQPEDRAAPWRFWLRDNKFVSKR